MVTFGTQTASATKPDSRASYSFGSTPGGKIADHVAVRNYSAQRVTLSLKGTDLGNSANGAITAVPVNEPSKDLGTWITLPATDRTVTLAPRQTLIVPFTIRVPKNATPGDHFAAVTATLTGSALSKSGQKIRLLQTTGTRVFLRVSGPLHPHLSITHFKVHYKGPLSPVAKGRATITYTVSNDGNVGMGGRQNLYVKGMFGTKAKAFKVPELQLLLPGDSFTETATVKEIVPEVHESAHVTITSLYIAGTQNPPSGPFQASSGFWAIPWIILAIIVVLLLIAAALLYRWRRRRRIRRGKVKGAPGGSGGEEAHGVDTREPQESGIENVSPEAVTPTTTEGTHMKKSKPLLVAALAVAASMTSLLLPGQATAATTVPFTDQNAVGAIGFCNAQNQPVTSGSLLTEPFVWKAVSTVAAPAGYTEASLDLFQPIQHVDPSDWTGSALTGVATFNNPQHPASQAITIDPPLFVFKQSLPPYWDGLYQVRMFFTSPLKPQVTSPYPAAVIQVQGNSWTLISGGKVDCNSSSAVSKLVSELPKKVVDTPQTIVVGGKKPNAQGSGKTGGKTAGGGATGRKGPASAASSTVRAAPTAGSSTGAATTVPSHLAAGTVSSGGRGGLGSSGWWIGLIAAMVVLGGAGATFGVRRRRSAQN